MPPRRKKSDVPAVVEKEATPVARGSIMKLKIGERLVDVVKDRSCLVCMHPARAQIEERILYNDGYQAISDWVSDVGYERIDGVRVEWPAITAKQITSHYKRNHCPVGARVMKQLHEEANGKLIDDYERMTTRVVDSLVFTRLIVNEGQERLVRGEYKITAKEALAAARLDLQVQQNAQMLNQVDRSQYYERAFQIFVLTAEKIMDPEQWQAFSIAIRNNADLKALIEKANQLPEAETA